MSTKGNIILPLGKDVAERQTGILYGWTEGCHPIYITQEAYDSILSQARRDAPIESCGYALGKKQEGLSSLPRIVLLPMLTIARSISVSTRRNSLPP